jgi:hypothetical protein
MEQLYRNVEDEEEAPLLFIGELLPMMSGIVQVGSSVKDFRRAVAWARSTAPNADPGSFLTTLTLLYLLSRGKDKFSDSDDYEKRERWQAMWERVQVQLQMY